MLCAPPPVMPSAASSVARSVVSPAAAAVGRVATDALRGESRTIGVEQSKAPEGSCLDDVRLVGARMPGREAGEGLRTAKHSARTPAGAARVVPTAASPA